MDTDDEFKNEINKEIHNDGLKGLNIFAPFAKDSKQIKEDYIKMNKAQYEGKYNVINKIHG